MHLAGIFHNLYLKVQERESVFYKDDKGWRFYVHDPSEAPTIGVQTHGTSLYPGQGRDLRLDLKKVRFCVGGKSNATQSVVSVPPHSRLSLCDKALVDDKRMT